MLRRWIFGTLTAFTCSGAAIADPLYTVRDLGLLPGANSATASSINNDGVVVGTSIGADGSHLFSYDGTLHDLGQLAGMTYATPAGLNSLGQIAGFAYSDPRSAHAFLYDGTFHDLGLADALGSRALSINDAGRIVGTLNYPDTTQHAFFYDGTMHDLTTALGSTQSTATGINNAGRIVGSVKQEGLDQAYLYDGTVHMLGALSSYGSVATSISATGLVVGNSTVKTASQVLRSQAFFWDGTIHQLTAPGASVDTGDVYANAIDSAGQVVGFVNGTDLAHLALLWDAATHQGHYLNDLIDPASDWNLEVASAINDSGQIVGYGSHPASLGQATSPHAFLLTPRIPGDANLDGAVNFSDLLILAQHYGVQTVHFTQGDFDSDGMVGFSDLLLLAQHYGQGQSQFASAVSAVPEPNVWAYGLAGSALFLRRRTRGMLDLRS